MTPKDMLDALNAIGWSQADLGRRIKAHPNTISGWATGSHPIPGSVEAYLRLVVAFKAVSVL